MPKRGIFTDIPSKEASNFNPLFLISRWVGFHGPWLESVWEAWLTCPEISYILAAYSIRRWCPHAKPSRLRGFLMAPMLLLLLALITHLQPTIAYSQEPTTVPQ